jgi:transketolase
VRVVGQSNQVSFPHTPGRFHFVRRVAGPPVVLAVGPVLDVPDVVLVEPWLAGTSSHAVAAALHDVPHRLLALGVSREREIRRYGRASEHIAAHGLDVAGIRASIEEFLGRGALHAVS